MPLDDGRAGCYTPTRDRLFVSSGERVMYVKCFFWAGLGLYALLSVADWMLTFALLRIHPGAVESNPLAAACLDLHGWRGLALYKLGGVLVFAAAAVLILRRRPAIAAGVVEPRLRCPSVGHGYSHGLLCQRTARPRSVPRTAWRRESSRAVAGSDIAVPSDAGSRGEKKVEPATVLRDRHAPTRAVGRARMCWSASRVRGGSATSRRSTPHRSSPGCEPILAAI